MEELNHTPLSSNPQLLYMWKAPLRPFKKRGKNILRFYIALALLLSLIVFFFGDRILLVPIWTLLFLFYVYTITPPPDVENKITKFGIETAGMTLRWEILSHFFFTKRFGYEVVTVVSHEPYYLHAYMVIPNAEVKRQVMVLLTKHLIYQEKPMQTFTDKMVDLFAKLVPDDEDTINTPASLSQTRAPASP
jgi:hypothetical protein